LSGDGSAVAGILLSAALCRDADFRPGLCQAGRGVRRLEHDGFDTRGGGRCRGRRPAAAWRGHRFPRRAGGLGLPDGAGRRRPAQDDSAPITHCRDRGRLAGGRDLAGERTGKPTFAVYVDNKPGVLTRVSSLLRRRAFNIESLTVGHTETPGISRMTIVVDTDEGGARLVEANLYKLIAVRRGDNITKNPTIARGLAMVKVSATGDARTQVMQLVDVYRARIVDVSPESLVIETTGTEDKIDSLLEVLRPYGVIEMVRTGRVEMVRGTASALKESAPRAQGAGAVDSRDASSFSV